MTRDPFVSLGEIASRLVKKMDETSDELEAAVEENRARAAKNEALLKRLQAKGRV